MFVPIVCLIAPLLILFSITTVGAAQPLGGSAAEALANSDLIWADAPARVDQWSHGYPVGNVVQGDPLNFNVELTREGSQHRVDGQDLIIHGKASGDGTRYEGRIRFRLTGGEWVPTEQGVAVTGAQSVRMLIAAATDFNRHDVDSPLSDGWQAPQRRSVPLRRDSW